MIPGSQNTIRAGSDRWSWRRLRQAGGEDRHKSPAEIRNPKTEIRKKPEGRNPKRSNAFADQFSLLGSLRFIALHGIVDERAKYPAERWQGRNKLLSLTQRR